ncbi:hypothetical protein WJX75_009493 [Coccomyxa subellipsoidea]|uniref:Uncharacterized protein n=1 Tax=Coccomyxa subellipsoidea TaxID=248742 RepID=A0ABR2YYT4_9CHLO
MHSFCRECVEAELVGSSGGNICPACARDGERTLLGANPFAYHRLQPDFVLEALVRKIFPRHILSDYEKRRPKYVPQRIGQLITEPGTRPSRARGQQMPPADVVPLFLHQKGKGDEDGTGKKLDMPYLRVPKGLLVAVLAKYVAQRVCEAEAKIQLFHKDKALSEGQTIHEAAEACLPPDSIGSTLLELCYAVVQVAPGQNSEAEEEPDGRPAKRVQLPT